MDGSFCDVYTVSVLFRKYKLWEWNSDLGIEHTLSSGFIMKTHLFSVFFHQKQQQLLTQRRIFSRSLNTHSVFLQATHTARRFLTGHSLWPDRTVSATSDSSTLISSFISKCKFSKFPSVTQTLPSELAQQYHLKSAKLWFSVSVPDWNMSGETARFYFGIR